MRTFRPTTDVRIQAEQFVTATTSFIDSFPMRIVLLDSETNEIRYELWVESDLKWVTVLPGDWIVKGKVGFYPIEQEVFKTKYEEV